jgi:hypothetical protein
MALEAFLADSSDAACVEAVVNSIMGDVSLTSFETSMRKVTEASIPLKDLSNFLLALARKLEIVKNLPLRLELCTQILRIAETRFIGETYREIQYIYADALEENGCFIDAAKYLQSWTDPEGEHDLVRHLLRIGEDFLAAEDCSSAFSYLNKMTGRIFTRSTPTDLLERFYIFKGDIQIHRLSFIEAAMSFISLWKIARDANRKLYAVRIACICLILAPISRRRTNFLQQILEDETTKSLDVYFMVDLIIRGKFIDRQARDEFAKRVGPKIANYSALNALDRSSTQHNVSVAQHMYASVKIQRLAQLIGDSADQVTRQLVDMIAAKVLRATIDQTEDVVIFSEERADRKDQEILEFCDAVNEVVRLLPDVAQ